MIAPQTTVLVTVGELMDLVAQQDQEERASIVHNILINNGLKMP